MHGRLLPPVDPERPGKVRYESYRRSNRTSREVSGVSEEEEEYLTLDKEEGGTSDSGSTLHLSRTNDLRKMINDAKSYIKTMKEEEVAEPELLYRPGEEEGLPETPDIEEEQHTPLPPRDPTKLGGLRGQEERGRIAYQDEEEEKRKRPNRSWERTGGSESMSQKSHSGAIKIVENESEDGVKIESESDGYRTGGTATNVEDLLDEASYGSDPSRAHVR